MEFALVPQIAVNGLSTGLIYILMALGFSLIFSILGVFNFAHGEFYMLGAFGAYYITGLAGLPFPLSIVAGAVGTAVLGLVVERFTFRPLRDQTLASFIIALGLSMGLSTTMALVVGPRTKTLTAPISGVANLFGAVISWQKVAVILISAALVVGLHVMINHTRFGRTIRAVAGNPQAAALVGVKTNRLRTQTFAIATGLAGAAGVLMAPIYNVTPYMGADVIFKVMVVVILGGLGSIPGAILGGLVLGFIESVGMTYMGGIANLIGWCLVILLLLARPQGLLGKA